jgi:uncharacterized protein (DUF952 family)
MVIFHLLPAGEWERALAAGRYAPASLAEVGFIHFCDEPQLLAVAARFFRGRTDLLVLSVRPERLRAPLRREPADGQLFPHLYGTLELEAIDAVAPLPCRDGVFVAPAGWRTFSTAARRSIGGQCRQAKPEDAE